MAEKLRNVALIGHGGAGKTSLAEVMLYNAGVTNRIGTVEAGNTVMDFEPEELKRNASISTGFHQFEWNKNTVSLIDTPGDQNFFSDTKLCMQAADCAVVVLDAIDGVKFQSEQAWEFADDYQLPLSIFINKIDRERSDFDKALKDAIDIFEPKPITLQLPIGKEADFKGIVDLIQNKAFLYENGKSVPSEIPSDMIDQVETEREALIENIAEADDALVEKYLEGEELTDDDINTALRKGTLNRTFVPVLCGSVTKNIGVDLLCNFIADVMPSPLDASGQAGVEPGTENEINRQPDPNAPFSAFVFKTIADPYSGRLTIFKVVSGQLGGDGTFYNATKDSKERYHQLLTLAGKEQTPVNGAGPGSIVAVAKLKETKTGDTLCDPEHKIHFTTAKAIEGTVSYAIVPKSQGDEDKIFSSLAKLMEEDKALRIERNMEIGCAGRYYQ